FAIGWRLAFFDRPNRSRGRPVGRRDDDVCTLKLSQHAGQPALVFILSSRLNREWNIRQARGWSRSRVVTYRADAALAQIELDLGSQSVVDVRVLRRYAHLRD